MNKWYIEAGAESDVVISTRVRLARNLTEYPFPARLNSKQREAVNDIVCKAVKDCTSCPDGFKYIKMDSLEQSEAISLAEKHLISPEFATERDSRGLLLSNDESVSIMLCEEDHIRMQVMHSGLALFEAYDVADKLDTELDNKLNFAFDERLGFLTQCPTNIGTGMRASVMLHLPALTARGQIGRLAATISKLGLTIRGTYGEGTTAIGDIYQLSNQVTLGISEKAALENLNSIAMQVIAQERAARKELLGNIQFEDKIWRAFGILTNARLLSSDEFMELISYIRLGSAMKIINIGHDVISSLIADAQPATLTAQSKKNLDAPSRDKLRADIVREKLKQTV